MTDIPKDRDALVELRAKAICLSRMFETGEGTCAPVCMDVLGFARRNCTHCFGVHQKLVEAIFKAEEDAGLMVVPVRVTDVMVDAAELAERESRVTLPIARYLEIAIAASPYRETDQLADYKKRAHSQIEQGISKENTELDSAIFKEPEK